MLDEYYLLSTIPSLDLHGLSRDIARSLLIEFINDNIKMKNKIIRVIHGIGKGYLKDEVHLYLKQCYLVIEYKLEFNNPGSTIILLKVN